jgi:mannose-6-phosphate isomerase
MPIHAPIVFEPLLMQRVWGGRRLETLYGKHLPPGVRIGESWEIVDRVDAQSVVHNEPLRGATLHELWTQRREEIFGRNLPDSPRFPLLFKLLDCQDRLSVQVHPPAEVAPQLNGEPKTEMWYLMATLLDSDLYAGLKRGVTREQFEQALGAGNVAELIHRMPTRAGEAIFIPSGRVHAIGSGNVIFEVQQNSDTTYRVFDWNRLGLDGKPRELHLEESLASINFDDPEPTMAEPLGELIVECPYFRVERWELTGDQSPRPTATDEQFGVFTVANGEIDCGGMRFTEGASFLAPASSGLQVSGKGTLLKTTI